MRSTNQDFVREPYRYTDGGREEGVAGRRRERDRVCVWGGGWGREGVRMRMVCVCVGGGGWRECMCVGWGMGERGGEGGGGVCVEGGNGERLGGGERR